MMKFNEFMPKSPPMNRSMRGKAIKSRSRQKTTKVFTCEVAKFPGELQPMATPKKTPLNIKDVKKVRFKIEDENPITYARKTHELLRSADRKRLDLHGGNGFSHFSSELYARLTVKDHVHISNE